MSKRSDKIPVWSHRRWHTLDYDAGSGLSHLEVQNLEKILIENPNNSTARLLLAGYFGMKKNRERESSEYLKHLTWLIDNTPFEPSLKCLAITKEMECFDLLKLHWNKAVSAYPENAAVLVNAAMFFQFASFNIAESLWKRVVNLEPANGEYYRQLSSLYRIHATNQDAALLQEHMRKSVEFFCKALEANKHLPQEIPSSRDFYRQLSDLKKIAVDFGFEKEASFLETYAPKHSRDL